MASRTTFVRFVTIVLFLLAIPLGFLITRSFWSNTETELDENRDQTSNIILASIELVLDSDPEKHELFTEFYEPAEELLETMTLEEKIGQMFLARFPDNSVLEEIEAYHPGGYILFGKDFRNETKDSISAKLHQYQAASKIKLFLGVDEEGGMVVRVSNYPAFRSSKFLSPQQLWAQGGLTAIIKDSTEKSALLKSLGLNMNLAPVADVATSSSAFIYERTYGQDAKKTAKYIAEVVQTMKSDQIISVLKHFPGYGDNVDTHTGIAIDERPYNAFQTNDFLPFISGITAGVPCILVSHNIIVSMDADKPASLSENVHRILRQELRFSGLIITDDLAMDAVETYTANKTAAVQAVLAGNDLIISSDFAQQSQEVISAVQQGIISEDQINQAVKRILACKFAYGIIQ